MKATNKQDFEKAEANVITVTEGDRSCVPFRLVSLIIGV